MFVIAIFANCRGPPRGPHLRMDDRIDDRAPWPPVAQGGRDGARGRGGAARVGGRVRAVPLGALRPIAPPSQVYPHTCSSGRSPRLKPKTSSPPSSSSPPPPPRAPHPDRARRCQRRSSTGSSRPAAPPPSRATACRPRQVVPQAHRTRARGLQRKHLAAARARATLRTLACPGSDACHV